MAISSKETKPRNIYDTESTANFFDKLGEDYIASVNKDYKYIYSRTMAVIRPYLSGKILNLGSGGIGLVLNSNTNLVVSLDISKTLLKYHETIDRHSVVCGEAGRLPFRSGSFDTVVAHFSLHHFAQRSAKITFAYLLNSFNEINRIVKAGGKFIIAENTVSKTINFLEKITYPIERGLLRLLNRPPVYLFSAGALEQFLMGAGFQVVYFTRFKATAKALILPFSIPRYINPISISVLIGEKKA